MSKQCDDFQFPSDFRRAKSGDEISKLITTFHETMNKEFGEKEVNLEDLAERLGEALEVRRQKLFDEMFTDQTSRTILECLHKVNRMRQTKKPPSAMRQKRLENSAKGK